VAAFYDWAEGEVLGDQHRVAHNHLGYIKSGTGSPEGVETADVGSIFLRTNGGAATTLYVKETGTGNTGWVALGSIASAITVHEAASDPHTGYRLESADHTHASSGAQAGQVDHGALGGLADDDHPQYETSAEAASKITTHEGLADPHTGYRLESADHAHTSTGAAAGQLDHGTALTGLSDDDHPQYMLESLFDAAGDLIIASAADTPTKLARGSDDQVLRSTGSTIAWESNDLTVGGVILTPTDAQTIIAWRAPFACTVTAVHAQSDTGTTAVVNAGKGFAGGTTEFCSADITIDPSDAWEAGTVNQNQSLVAGDAVYLEVVDSGTATQITIQVTLTRP
jgi:hypothetical protein